VGENVVGMDVDAQLTKGKVTASPELKRRVDLFRKFWMERTAMSSFKLMWKTKNWA